MFYHGFFGCMPPLTNTHFPLFSLSSEAFETLRLGIVIFAVLLRFALMPVYLQTYLNLAYQRIEDQKKEAGRITNTDYQKKITSIFYYLCVVTLQYAAPILMCLFFTLMYKTLGDFKWSALMVRSQIPGECSADPIEEAAALAAVTVATTTEASFDAFETIPDNVNEIVDDSNILSTAEHFQLSFKSLKNVFTTEVYRGIFGFATWWSCFVWFGATSLGMVYQSYFVKS
jgi:Predicted transmembrane protein 161AB